MSVFKGRAVVHGFEANPTIAQDLYGHIKSRNIVIDPAGSFNVHNNAVGNIAGNVTLAFKPGVLNGGLVQRNDSSAMVEDNEYVHLNITSLTLDQFDIDIGQQHWFYIKVDIEGGEVIRSVECEGSVEGYSRIFLIFSIIVINHWKKYMTLLSLIERN